MNEAESVRSVSNQPGEYDEQRVATLEPVRAALVQLGLPLARYRKLNGIMGALEMQIEDGGDSPAVNTLLVQALHAAVIHQVGEDRAKPVFVALDGFVRAEARRNA